jgi:hypothetical protein
MGDLSTRQWDYPRGSDYGGRPTRRRSGGAGCRRRGGGGSRRSCPPRGGWAADNAALDSGGTPNRPASLVHRREAEAATGRRRSSITADGKGLAADGDDLADGERRKAGHDGRAEVVEASHPCRRDLDTAGPSIISQVADSQLPEDRDAAETLKLLSVASWRRRDAYKSLFPWAGRPAVFRRRPRRDCSS